MIRHCVFIRFRTAVTRAERDELLGEITGLQGRLPGIVSVHSGTNGSPEVGMDQGFTEGFIIDFTGSTDRDDYLADAEHQRIGTRIVAAAQGGSAGVLVFDLEID